MRKIVLTEWVTLDGFSSNENDQPQFVGEFFSPEMGKYESDILDTGDTLILGRKTYDSFAGAWPKRETDPDTDPNERDYAKRLNQKKKIVFSKSMNKASWNNTVVVQEINPDEIKKWKEEEGKNILIYGSASIVQQLTDLGLVDEYQILVHPTIIGKGVSLFKDVQKKNLKLVSSKEMTNGVVLLTYQI